MKSTSESRRRWAVLLTLLAGAAALVSFGDKTPSDAAPVVAARPRPQATPAAARAAAADPAATRPIEVLQARSELAATRPPQADLFAVAPWRRPAPPPPAPAAVAPPPVAPPLNYKVLGKKQEGAHWEIFLGRDEMSLIVRAGDTLEQQWRVDRVEPPTLTLTHLPTGQQQTLNVGDAR